MPAQHYQCGGVVTDLDGATAIPRLYAAGEVACTGVHGANRLASNSLLEAMVFAYRAARHTLDHCGEPVLPPCPELACPASFTPGSSRLTQEEVIDLRTQIQRRMQLDVGIVRTTAELERAKRTLTECMTRLSDSLPIEGIEGMETRNMAQVGLLIIESALRRHESRGLHYTLDYPEPIESERHDTMLSRG